MEIYSINDKNGDLKLQYTLKTTDAPSLCVLSPDGKYLYLNSFGNRKSDVKPALTTYSVLPGGKLKKISQHDLPARSIFIATDPLGEYLFACGGGNIHTLKLKKGVFDGEILDSTPVEKGAHSVKMHPDGRFLYVPHIRVNKVYQFEINRKAGKLKPLDPPWVSGPDDKHNYHDPRHIFFHSKKQVVYTSGEKQGGISSWKKGPGGKLTLWQTFSTLPKNFNWKSGASDITLTPDNAFAIVANRDVTDKNAPEGNDSIMVFNLNQETGEIKKSIGPFSTGRHPRCVITDKTGKYIYVSGVHSDNIHIYDLKSSGKAILTKVIPVGESPMWMAVF